MVHRFRLALIAAATVAVLTAAGGPAPGEEAPDVRFAAGLRERKLYRLAETFCGERLADPGLAEPLRADMVVELSQALAEWAVDSPPAERPGRWQRAWDVTEQFARQSPANPRLVLVRFQGALGLLARGELSRQEAQVSAQPGPLVEQSRQALRGAIGQLQAVAAQITEQSSRRSVARPGPDDLTSAQLATLLRNVEYQVARAYRNQGECYPAGSPDSANSLGQALRLLDPLAAIDPPDSLAWRAAVDAVMCYRLLGDLDSARRKLALLGERHGPPSVELRCRAERVRLALAAGRLPEALEVIALGREVDGAVSAELDYAWLEAYLAAWQTAEQSRQSESAAQWKTKAAQSVDAIARLYGPYWGRRAQMLLASRVQASPDTEDTALLVHAAENAFRSGKPDEALAAYDRASAAAGRQGDAGRAFDLAYLAAAIEHQRGRHEEAWKRFRQAALAKPDHPKAAEAHQLAAFHAAQLALAQPGLLPQYAALLEEYLAKWPTSGAANPTRRRLGQVRELQQNWPAAAAAYRAVSPDDSEHKQAIDAAGRCYRAWIAELRARGRPVDTVAAEAAAWLESLVLGPQGKPPEIWAPLQCQAAVEAGRLWLETVAGPPRAQRILSAALAGARNPEPAWKAAAEALLVAALAAEGRRQEAAELMARISGGPSEQLLSLVESLGRLGESARPEVRAELAALELRALELLQPRAAQLSETTRRSLERLSAAALADAGRTEQALAAYEALAKAYPRDGKIQEEFARLLSTRSDAASLEAARARWLEILSHCEAGSPRWFRAEYHVTLLDYRLGRRDKALAIIRRLEVLYPSLGGPELKAQFSELAERCGK